MAGEDIREQIRRLVRLQDVDERIYALKTELTEKPRILLELKEAFERKKKGLKDLQEQLKEIQVRRQAMELDLKGFEESIAKDNAQLSQIKTNKEYTAKMAEIEHLKADKSLLEEKILLSYDESDALQERIAAEQERLAGEETVHRRETDRIQAEIKAVEAKVHALQAERETLAAEVAATVRGKYERILDNRGDRALVAVERGSCSGCYMKVPAQVVNEIKMYEDLVTCEMCSRILYIPEDLE